MYVMTGSAITVSTMHTRISVATGAASITRRRGVVRPTTLQNNRMPMRVSAMIAARPVPSIVPTNTHEYIASGAVGATSTAADNSANLETKPDSGGNPATSNAQETNANPRNAMAAGIATPTSSSTSMGSSESSAPNAPYVTAG